LLYIHQTNYCLLHFLAPQLNSEADFLYIPFLTFSGK
jgi:hypothetical protein